MNGPLIDCQGIRIGKLSISPFQLSAGQVLCWQMPDTIDWDLEKLVTQHLTGSRHVPGLHISGQVFWADPGIMAVQGFWQKLRYRFHRPLIINKLAREARISKQQ